MILRASLAISVTWVVTVLFTMFVYNPAGIAAATEQGGHFPESLYDNNTVGVAIVGGWISPALAVLIFSLSRTIMFKLRRANHEQRDQA
jgi:hypothetical protein